MGFFIVTIVTNSKRSVSASPASQVELTAYELSWLSFAIQICQLCNCFCKKFGLADKTVSNAPITCRLLLPIIAVCRKSKGTVGLEGSDLSPMIYLLYYICYSVESKMT